MEILHIFKEFVTVRFDYYNCMKKFIVLLGIQSQILVYDLALFIFVSLYSYKYLLDFLNVSEINL